MSRADTESEIRIAIVEDDEDLRQSMADYLRARGHPVWAVGDAASFYKRMLTDPAMVVILDISLPGEDGFAIARHTRKLEGVEIIIVSGRETVEDRLRGLKEGANRYLVKPVDLRELEANVIALGRSRHFAPAGGGYAPTEAGWHMDEEHWKLTSPDGHVIALTSREWQFLRCLLHAEGRTASKEQVASALYGSGAKDFDYHRIDMVVMRLRKKIRQATGKSVPIQTLQSQGFVFSAPCHID